MVGGPHPCRDTVTGAQTLTTTDISVPGVAGTLSFTRAYSSDSLILPGQTPPIGNRWTHTWQAGLLVYGTGQAQSVVAITPGGGAYPFAWNGSAWVPAKGVNATPPARRSTATTRSTARRR